MKDGPSHYYVSMERKVPLIEGECFHIYNRGVDKRIIFQDIHDYHRFIMLLYLCNSVEAVDLQKLFREGRSFADMFKVPRKALLVEIGAWVLMPNHFHLALKVKTDGGLTLFMKKLCTGYSVYINKKYERSGSLFQGRYKAEHVSDDRYLKYLFSYIHLNPVKLISGEEKWKDVGLKDEKNAINFINKYEYSSFPDYLGNQRSYGSIIQKKYFSDTTIDFEEMIKDTFEWLDTQSRDL